MNKSIYKKSLYYSYLNLAILALSQIILVPLILKHTSESEYGVYIVFLTIVVGFTNIIGWLGASSVKLLSEHYHNNDFESFNKLYSLLKVAFFLYSLFTFILFLILNEFYINEFLLIDGNKPVLLSLFVFVFVFLLINTNVESNVMTALARLDLLNKYKFYVSVFTFGLSLFLLYSFKSSSMVFLSNALCVLIVFTLIKYFIYQKKLNISVTQYWNFEKKDIKKVFIDIGGKAFVYSILRYFLLADVIILSLLMKTEDIAMYSYYWLPANYLIIILWKFSENAQPFFMKNFSLQKSLENIHLYQTINKKIVLLSVIASIGYFLIFPYFVYYWVGLDNIDYLALLAFSIIIFFLAIYRLDLAVLYSNIKYIELIKITLFELFIKYIFVFIFYKQFGFFVSILGHLLAQILFVFWYSKRLSKIELKGNP